MKLLLDTNIILHRESKEPSNKDIGKLFGWIDKLGYTKCIHQITIDEILKIQNKKVRDSFLIKMESYYRLPTVAPIRPEVQKISQKYDENDNDLNDTKLINEVYLNRVDFLLTEDRKIHQKGLELGIDDRIYTIDAFLEKVLSENPDFKDYQVLSVKREYFGNININDDFFDSLKEDYPQFEDWFNRKSDQIAYICYSDDNVVAFLYLKVETVSEPYQDINPIFPKKKRLKIGTFKVKMNGLKLGERFLKIIFDNALLFSVNEIYVTIFPKRLEQKLLIKLLQDFGFNHWGYKTSSYGEEEVYTRDFSQNVLMEHPKLTYPFIAKNANKYLVSIYPEYHTDLFPDSILRTESPLDFIENAPFRNAISKVFITRSYFHDLKPGDIIIFYRTGGRYKGVITTIGIVENIHDSIKDIDHFISLCRKRSVFTDDELKNQWDRSPNNRPFVVNFLYVYSFPKRLNLNRLIELGIVRDIQSAPRGFDRISNQSFNRIIQETGTNGSLIVD